MIVLLVAHLVAALIAPVLVARLGRVAFAWLALAPAAAAGWAAIRTPEVLAGAAPTELLTWVPSIGLELAFRLDVLSWLLTLVAGAIGALVLVYCAAYFEEDEPGLGRFAACLVGFAGAMLGLVTSDDLLVLYLFWEATTVLSYLLIGHRPQSRSSRSAATQALVVTTFGGLAMLGGLIVVGQRVGTYRLSEVVATFAAAPIAPGDTLLVTAVVLVLLGAVSKSALVPFHFWLPAAMAAPTPVSAYLHAAAMVKAGIYLVARLAPAFADVPAWRWCVLVLGGATMLLGAYRSLRQHDLKLLLAYGTVSQLGFLVVLTGTGTPDAALAGVALLLAHAMFKACLFLVVGVMDHATSTRDLRELNGLRASMPVLAVTAAVAAASMAGLPPTLGFVAKEAALAAYARADAADLATLAVLVVGSMLTFAYSARFVWGAFWDGPARNAEPTHVHAPGAVLVGVPAVLAAASLLAPLAAGPIDTALLGYAGVFGEPHEHLALWHGLTPALGLSVLTWLVGSALFAGRAGLERAQDRVPEVPAAEDVYRRIMRGLDRVSLEVTGASQRGSLPLTLGAILVVFVALPGGVLVATAPWGELSLRWADSAAQVGVAIVTVIAAVAAVRARRRFRAIYLVGVTGYASAMIFLLFGAPDLALTQVLVETVSVVLFILVLRRLPGRFDDEGSRGARAMRVGFGVAVGAVAAALAVVVPQARTAAPASDGMAELAVDYGGGENIVNVILVDIRAWDTMGELSVVLAAATGVASLVFLHRDNVARADRRVREMRARRRRALGRGHRPADGTDGTGGRTWLVGHEVHGSGRHSTMFEVVTRMIFHVVMTWSLFLLFAGHNNPGGGFAAGLVAGLALVVRYLAGGRVELRSAMPVAPRTLLGLGLFLSAGNALASMIASGDPLQTWIFDVPVPLIGKVHVVTSLAFDVGVYLVVIGLMLDVLRSLGSSLDRQIEDEEHRRAPSAPQPVGGRP
ncbi:Na+/H+ antiporter subunit A [Agilicoccus flavus]|uniref:Na+/H+ antiporter subunit A n=1 Tax=Agilicoccus flavus TaxID=2775968 RepID=UPI001CF630B2|nr:Na+/H+ antiporter subunit A [Agilicoccus flavus]